MRMNESRSVPIDAIVVGDRRREDFGDIDGLAASIRLYGLLHPIVIDDDNNLVAGERRLRACRALGMSDVDVTNVGLLSAASRREIELEENLRRKDLTPHERDKTLVRLVETATEALREEGTDLLPKSGEKSKRGRPPKVDSDSKVAERIGVPRQTIEKARERVRIAETFPVMQAPDWKQDHVLKAGKALATIDEEDRPKVVKLVDQVGIPAGNAVAFISNIAEMPKDEQKRIVALSESPDVRERNLALTTAAGLPPNDEGPTPQEYATAQRAARKWREAIADIRMRVNSVRDHGGIRETTKQWSDAGRKDLYDEVDRLITQLTEIRDDLEDLIHAA
jgi:ParB-like chromosome segregation protein Spo0J